MNITSVHTDQERKVFINLPYSLYKKDANWVAPLRDEMHGQFDPVKNPLLDHCEYELFLLWKNEKPIGRIAAFIDTLAVDYWKEKIGLFGYYECPNDPQASKMLLEAASQWLRQKGMAVMRGPWSFVSQEWGSVLEGFTPPPVVMSPYNPPFYNQQYEAFGLSKVKDLLVYYIDARDGYQIPERILTLTDKVAQRYGVRVRQLDVKNFDQRRPDSDRLIQ